MIGERIRQRRIELGFSLRELGARSGLTASFLSQVEHNQPSPSLASLQRIATALDVPMFTFLNGERQPSPVIRNTDRPKLREFAAASDEELQVICCLTPPVL